LLDTLEARLRAEAKPCQIKIVFKDKRGSDDDTALITEARRLAGRYWASLEILEPRNSYDGTTTIVLPIEGQESSNQR
jgi:hypothetical protein